MSNNIKNLTDAQLLALVSTMQNGLDSNLAAYGVTTSEFTVLETDSGNFNTAVIESDNLDAAKKAATQNKRTRKTKLGTTATNLAKKIYANVAVTDQMLAAIGLSPRASGSTRTTPKTPTDFIATPQTNGEVNFKWKRNGNTAGVIFNIQQQTENGWITIYATSRVREKLMGFPSGVEAFFRVTAQVNGQTSGPSNEAVIYAEGSSTTLEVAA